MHGYIGRQTLSLLFFQEDISQKVLFLFAAGEIVTVQEDPARTETAEDLPVELQLWLRQQVMQGLEQSSVLKSWRLLRCR